MKSVFSAAALLAAASALGGCASLPQSNTAAARATMLTEIQAEPKGDYYIGRRYYKADYKFWGYIRKPGQPWTSAKLVMLNENRKQAPDREQGGPLGLDNGYEYKLSGYFSGETVYEPASNGFYPEFVLTGATVRNTDPAPIFKPIGPALDPNSRVIITPY